MLADAHTSRTEWLFTARKTVWPTASSSEATAAGVTRTIHSGPEAGGRATQRHVAARAGERGYARLEEVAGGEPLERAPRHDHVLGAHRGDDAAADGPLRRQRRREREPRAELDGGHAALGVVRADAAREQVLDAERRRRRQAGARQQVEGRALGLDAARRAAAATPPASASASPTLWVT